MSADEVKIKICSKCGKELPATEEYFNKHKGARDNLRGYCKLCERKYKKQYREFNRKMLSEKNHAKYEANKEAYSVKAKNYYSENKNEIIQTVNQYWLKNKEIIRERNRQWQKENREKCRKYSHLKRALKNKALATLTHEQWEQIKQHFNHACCYCGRELPLEQEHFTPLSKGGHYTKENIIPACKSCNCSKNNKDFFDWYPKQEFYSQEREVFIVEHLTNQQEEKEVSA